MAREIVSEYTKFAGELTVADIGSDVIISWVEGRTPAGKERIRTLKEVNSVRHAVAISTNKTQKTSLYGKTERATYGMGYTIEPDVQVVVQVVAK